MGSSSLFNLLQEEAPPPPRPGGAAAANAAGMPTGGDGKKAKKAKREKKEKKDKKEKKAKKDRDPKVGADAMTGDLRACCVAVFHAPTGGSKCRPARLCNMLLGMPLPLPLLSPGSHR